MTREQARQLRRLLENTTDSMTDDKIIQYPAFVEKWYPGKEYLEGKRLSHNNIVYRVLQNHTSQTGWEPDVASSLFAKVLVPTDENGQQISIPDWEQPDSTNTYRKDVKVRHNGKIWKSDYDNNSWEPGVFGWTEVAE